MLVDRFGNAFQQFKKGEQDTGLKWQDGRPIYRNYKRIDLSNTNLQGSVKRQFLFILWMKLKTYFSKDTEFAPLLIMHLITFLYTQTGTHKRMVYT